MIKMIAVSEKARINIRIMSMSYVNKMRKRKPRAMDSRGAEDVCSFAWLCLRVTH